MKIFLFCENKKNYIKEDICVYVSKKSIKTIARDMGESKYTLWALFVIFKSFFLFLFGRSCVILSGRSCWNGWQEMDGRVLPGSMP